MHNGRPRSTLVRYCYRSIWKLLAWKVRNSTGLRIISRSDGATDKIIIRYDNQIYSDGATVRVTAPPFASPAPSGPPTRATAAHAVPRGKLSAQNRNPAHCLSRPPPPRQPGVSQSLALQRRRHAFCLSRSRWENFPFLKIAHGDNFQGRTHTTCAPWTFGGEHEGKLWCSTKSAKHIDIKILFLMCVYI